MTTELHEAIDAHLAQAEDRFDRAIRDLGAAITALGEAWSDTLEHDPPTLFDSTKDAQ